MKKGDGIPAGKKRYTLTLTTSVVDRFQLLCKDFGMPAATMSNVANDALHEVANVFQVAKEQGKLDMSDIFRLMGKQVELLMDEEKEETKNVSIKNLDKIARKSSGAH